MAEASSFLATYNISIDQKIYKGEQRDRLLKVG